jgi:cytoplasmic tRNA 2-thiolation protein 2
VNFTTPEQSRKILLALSLGVSSISLLNILDCHLKTQRSKTGRTGFSLLVLFVDCSSVDNSAPNREVLDQVSQRYPDYEFAKVKLEDIFRDGAADDLLHDIFPDACPATNNSTLERLSTLMNSLTSATARADVVPMLKTRLIVEEAKRLGCEGVLWGDSTTRLAVKTLAETAKGRGFSLPWQIADGQSPFGVNFNFPLRDLLKKELVSYVDMLDPPLTPLVDQEQQTPTSISSKSTTIDDLVKQYFESAEQTLPSTVANVVRTMSKLEAKPTSDADARCKLCKMPVSDGRFGIHGWGGDQVDGLADSSSETRPGLCYGCTRSIPKARAPVNGPS